MKIQAAISLLLLVAVRAKDPGDPAIPSYPDTCDYNAGRVLCGDQCIDQYADCYCGSDTIQPYYDDDKYCCGESCTLNKDGSGVCRQGWKLSMSSPCNTTMRCYNSYQHSQHIGHQSHYTCPDTCVPWEAMCRGISHCEGDHQVCGPELRCPPRYLEGSQWKKVRKLNISSSIVAGHHFCLGDGIINNFNFDAIDGSAPLRAAPSPQDLDITSFTRCNTQYNDPGVMCGTECMKSSYWCRDDLTETCGTGSGNIATNDSALCQNPGVWDDVPCSSNNRDGRLQTYGLRCTGQNMRCVYPWYTTDDGLDRWGDTQCPDKSDQVFNSSLTCRQHLQHHLDFHTQKFCNDNYLEVYSSLICSNKTQWLSTQVPSYSDPHSCQSSCSVPSQNCLACSNSSYFACPKSGQCVHPDLICDGHPQCVEGEDEELSMCY